ncbi:MAG: hypothetical protein WA962_13785 [Ornithinimicrobium sp.]
MACAMPLSETTRQRLRTHLGCRVVDIREAPETTSIVLARALSLQATSILSEMFPDARVVTCQLLDDQHPTDIPSFSVINPRSQPSLSAAQQRRSAIRTA